MTEIIFSQEDRERPRYKIDVVLHLSETLRALITETLMMRVVFVVKIATLGMGEHT